METSQNEAQVLTFDNYSPARYAALQAEMAKRGLKIAGPSGNVKDFGADVSYSYAGNVLSITVHSAPHFYSKSHFTAELKNAVNAVPPQ